MLTVQTRSAGSMREGDKVTGGGGVCLEGRGMRVVSGNRFGTIGNRFGTLCDQFGTWRSPFGTVRDQLSGNAVSARMMARTVRSVRRQCSSRAASRSDAAARAAWVRAADRSAESV